jgi:hypothetical protein
VKAFLAAVLVLASASAAVAGPWQTDSIFDGDDLIGDTAYQWEDSVDNVLLGYDCDAMLGFEALYVQIDEQYDATTSYAPEVPTTFTVDGVAFDVSGVFENRDGYLFTYYDGLEDGVFELVEQLLIAKDSVTVSFFDKRYSFSAEGIGAALSTASELCY